MFGIQELFLILIGFIQGVFFIPFILWFPEFILLPKNQKSEDNFYHSQKIMYILAVIFALIIFGAVGMSWITYGKDNFDSELARAWGKGLFIGIIFFFVMKKKNQ